MEKESPSLKNLQNSRRVAAVLVVLCFVISLYFYTSIFNSNSLFDEVSKEDKLVIEPLLKDLVFNNHFGYVLVGEKPVSVASYFIHEPFTNLLFIQKSNAYNFEHSWKTLEKYRSKLNSRNFVLLKEKSNFFALKDKTSERNDVNVIILINKTLFLHTVEKHLDLFKKTLGDWVTPTSLLTKISEAKTSLFEILRYDEGLYGILLGYGKANALAFKRNLELARIVDPLFREIAFPFTLQLIKPSSHFHSLDEEYVAFQEQLSFSDLHFPLSTFVPPSFEILKDDDETALLKQRYRKAHRQLVKMYSEKDFLRVTLRQFLSDPHKE